MRLRALGTVLIAIFIFQGCSGSGSLSSDNGGGRSYDKSFEFIEKAVKGSINGSGLKIFNISEVENPQKMTITLVRSGYASSRSIPQETGEVRIVKLNESKTKIEIDNPEYEYTVPQRQRQDYRKVLFPRIEKLIEMNS